MLYERWRQVVAERDRELALHDIGARQKWTFQELHRLTEPAFVDRGPIIHPQGAGAGFILSVLRGWRSGCVVCPLESGQSPPAVPPPPNDCVHLKTTSATTGVFRVIAFTGPQLAADADNIVATMGLRPDWPNLGAISLAHSYGFSSLVLPLLLHGIPLILVPSPLPEAIRQAALNMPAVTLAGVPALWRVWHEADALPGTIRLAISAGAPLCTTIERAVHERSGLKIHNFLGASECGGIAFDASVVPRTDPACVGTPVRNVRLSVNLDRCLEVRSQAVGQGYWPVPEKILGQGSFQTSDLAEIKDGLVYLRGRASDQINVAGRKTSPDVIEGVLMEHGAVRNCLVFGVPDGDRHERIVACVQLRDPADVESVKRFLLERLPAWQIPKDFWVVESLAANQRGKISRAEWKQRYLDRPEGLI